MTSPRTDRLSALLRPAVEALLAEQLERAGAEFFFVQIGANDGASFDWVYSFVTRHRLRGIVVEPLQDMFAELCSNYRDHPQVTPLNLAIHRTAREIAIYRVDPKRAAGLPDWSKAIASVDPEHHRKSGTPSEVIIAENVRCVTLDELFLQHHVTRVDFLQIDVEGYDAEIIRMIDFRRIKPAIIRFEHNLPAGVMSRQDLADCAHLLISNGYSLVTDRVDAVAYLTELA